MFVTSWCIICAGCVVVVVATRQPLTSCVARPPAPLLCSSHGNAVVVSCLCHSVHHSRHVIVHTTSHQRALSSNCRLPFGVLDRDVVTAGRSGHGSQGRGTVAGHFLGIVLRPPHSLKICSSECLRQINFKICGEEARGSHIACLHSALWQPPSVLRAPPL